MRPFGLQALARQRIPTKMSTVNSPNMMPGADQTSRNYAIACELHGNDYQVSLSGRITIDSSPDLRNHLIERLRAATGKRVTIAFQNVSYIDTSGLAVLVELLKAAHDLGKSLHLSGLQERPRYLLESTGVLSLFDSEAA